VYLKTYNIDNQRVLACCDRELLGRTLKDGEIHFEISENFYGREEGTAEQLREGLAGCTIANLVGERSICVAVECGLVDAGNVIHICGVPHAQIMRF